MKKRSPAYAEHLLSLFTEILDRLLIVVPLQGTGVQITPGLMQGLDFVYRHGVCSVSEIGRGLSISYSAASQLADRLVKKGLVVRRENLRDRRLSEIILTDAGRRIVETVRTQRLRTVLRVLRRMDPANRESLVQNLEDFIAAAMEDPKTALDTCCRCGKEHLSECVINEVYKTATGTPIQAT